MTETEQQQHHPAPTMLARFGRGRLSRRRNREIVRHLLAQCANCRRAVSRYLPPGPGRAAEPVGPDGASRFDYSAAFAQARRETERRQAGFLAERETAPERFAAFLKEAPERQCALAATDPGCHTWAFCELLLDTARELCFQDPVRALELSKVGTEIAARVGGATYGEARVRDLQARAWAGLGNAYRIRADFRDSEESFAKAESLLKKGTGDPLEKANVLLLKSSLRGGQQRFREAFRMLDRVLAIGRRCGDSHLCGKALVIRGFFLGVANDPEAAIRHLTEGIRDVDPETDARLLVAAQHNLILFLAESGRYDEAMSLLERARPLYHKVGDQMSLLRLRWLEGKIGISLGQFAEAEEILRELRKELIERDLGFDAALLSLDLANIYARQGRSSEMRRLAEEMLPIFKSRDIHREAIAALLVFQKSAEMERVTLGLIREVSSYLKESRAISGLRNRDPR
jgi:tetratricopeptide (TPR) repeat protein